MKKPEIKGKMRVKMQFFLRFLLLIRFFLLNLHPINK